MAPYDPKKGPLYFVAYQQNPRIFGVTWRAEAQRTSFYIKARNQAQEWKISLHGPDPRHPGGPLFKLGYDSGFIRSGKARTTRDLFYDREPGPLEFPGQEVVQGVRLAIRLRTTWEMFQRGAPSGPNPGKFKGHPVARLVTAPGPLRVTDVDIYVSDQEPFWPGRRHVRRHDAGIGPLVNEAGQHLTMTANMNYLHTRADEITYRPHTIPASLSECVRGMHWSVAPEGYLLGAEEWIPRKALDSAQTGE